MNSLIKTIAEIKSEILDEKDSLLFMGLFFRNDVEELGDLVIIADWIKEGETRRTVKYVIEKFKSKDVDYTKYISNIVAFNADDNFVSHLALAFKNKKIDDSDGDIKLIKLFDDYIIKSIIFTEDFKGFEPKTLQKKTLQKAVSF